MRKEPIGLYIFRVVLGVGLFVFMCMLYWSSLLVEESVRSMRDDVSRLKSQVTSLKGETEKILQALQQGAAGRVLKPASSKMEPSDGSANNWPLMDPSLPNLLSEDPFYKTVLPKLLGIDFVPHGIFDDATVGKPDNLHPFSNWAHVASWISQCAPNLARMQFGKYESMAPNLAVKIEARQRKDIDVPEFWVFLRDDAFWQPLSEKMFADRVKLAPHFLQKHQVTAEDVKFYFDAMMNPFVQDAGAVSLRTYYGDVEEVKVMDKLTLVVRWKPKEVEDAEGKRVPKIKYIASQLTGQLRPLAGFVYKYFADGTKVVDDSKDPETYRTNSVWAQNFTEHWAKNIIPSCGPWVFQEMTDREIRFRRNSDYFNPLDALVEISVVSFKNTTDAIWQEFKINNIDTYPLQPSQLIEYQNFLKSDMYKEQEAAGDAIKRLDYSARSYLYIGWNEAKEMFKSKTVRQAMTMAIDRQRIIEQFLNGMGVQITGPFAHSSPAYDTSILPWPYDPQKAKELLEEEGWYDSDGDGILDKMIGGKRVPFEFSLTYYVKNPTTKSICEFVRTTLKEIGVSCQLHGVDIADLSTEFDEKSFDALCLGWMLGTPPEDPRQLWYSTGAKVPASSNAVGFANVEADKIIDALTFETNKEKRVELYHRLHRILYEEQPYTFLYAPKTALLYRSYVQNVFLPIDRPDLIRGANVDQPDSSIFWLKGKGPAS